ncbi:MAG: MerR family transcriptional regulator, partial [Candidatus Binataceae bacterium]
MGTLDDAAVRRAHTFSTRAAARILAISPDRIRYWVKRSLVRPLKGGRQMRFGFDDLLVMRLAKELLPTRHHLDPVRRCFERVRGMFGPARSVTSLRLANHEGQIVVRDGNVMVEAMTGQLLLNFEAPPAPGKVEERFGPA